MGALVSLGEKIFPHLLDAAWKATVLMGAAIGLQMILGKKRIVARYWLGVYCLVGIVVMPATSFLARGHRVCLFRTEGHHAAAVISLGALDAPSEESQRAPSQFLPGTGGPGRPAIPERTNDTVPVVSPVRPAAEDAIPARTLGAASIEPRGSPEVSVVESASPTNCEVLRAEAASTTSAPVLWRGVVGLSWMAGCVALLLRLVVAAASVSRIRRGSLPVSDPVLLELFERTKEAAGIKTRTKIRLGKRLSSPVFVGIFRPTILLPESLVREMPVEQLRPILIHELSHVRWSDYAVNILQRIAESFFFFHPFLWLISRQLSRLREEISDNWVLERCSGGTLYARALTELAERSVRPRRSRLATLGLFSHVSRFGKRIEHILASVERPATSFPWKTALALLSVFLSIVGFLSFASFSARAVEEEGKTAETGSATPAAPREVPEAPSPAPAPGEKEAGKPAPTAESTEHDPMWNEPLAREKVPSQLRDKTILVCPGCHRYIRPNSLICPFCGRGPDRRLATVYSPDFFRPWKWCLLVNGDEVWATGWGGVSVYSIREMKEIRRFTKQDGLHSELLGFGMLTKDDLGRITVSGGIPEREPFGVSRWDGAKWTPYTINVELMEMGLGTYGFAYTWDSAWLGGPGAGLISFNPDWKFGDEGPPWRRYCSGNFDLIPNDNVTDIIVDRDDPSILWLALYDRPKGGEPHRAPLYDPETNRVTRYWWEEPKGIGGIWRRPIEGVPPWKKGDEIKDPGGLVKWGCRWGRDVGFWRPGPTDCPTGRALALAEDGKGRIWLGGDEPTKGVGCFDKKSGKWTIYNEANGCPVKAVWGIAVDRWDNVWFTHGRDPIYRFDGETWAALEPEFPGKGKAGVPGGHALSVLSSRDFLVSTEHGLLLYNWAAKSWKAFKDLPYPDETGELPAPKAVGPEVIPRERAEARMPVVIEVAKDGRLLVGGTQRPLQAIDELMQKVAGQNLGVRIIVRADAEVAYRRVATVLDACARANISNVSFALGESEKKEEKREVRPVLPAGTEAPATRAAEGPFVYVGGEVGRPGKYCFSEKEPITLLRAIILAGGFTDFADRKRVILLTADDSGKWKRPEVNVSEILDKPELDPAVKPGDLIFVRRKGTLGL